MSLVTPEKMVQWKGAPLVSKRFDALHGPFARSWSAPRMIESKACAVLDPDVCMDVDSDCLDSCTMYPTLTQSLPSPSKWA